MSNASVTSSRREASLSELAQELESIRALNSGLKAYLEHLQTFKSNLLTMNKNCKTLNTVNEQWIHTISMIKR